MKSHPSDPRRAAFGLDRSSLQALLACMLPGALAMVLFKSLQASILVPSSLFSGLAVMMPELFLQASLLGTMLLGLSLLPTRRLPLLAVGLGMMSLQTLLGALDVTSVSLRYTPVSWIEMRQFAANPLQLWPVVRSVLTPWLVVGVGGMVAGIALAVAVQWRQTRRALTQETQPMRVGASSTLFGLAAPLVLLLAAQNQQEAHLKCLHAPALIRLGGAMLQEVRTQQHLTPVAPSAPLVLDRSAGRAPFNVLFFVLESTPRGATSLEGQETTPFLSQLAREGLEAPDAYTVQTHTSKALVGIHCGQAPFPQFKGLEAEGILLDRCLPEMLREGGYRTGFFQAPDLEFEARRSLARHMGFQQVAGGFEVETEGFAKVNYLGYEDRIILEPALRWASQDQQPWMMTVLTGTSHHPYITPDMLREGSDLSGQDEKAMHAASLRYTDGLLKSLLEGLEAQGALEQTLVVVVGDHGEAFGEHGQKHHDFVPYEEGVHIPLVLWGPNVLPTRTQPTLASGLHQQLDLMPTVLELLGWRFTQGTLPGKSLVTSRGHDQLWFSCVSAYECMGMREGSRKVLQRSWDSEVEVYELSQDPAERTNLASTLTAQQRHALQDQLLVKKFQLEARYMGRALQHTQGPLESASPTPLSVAERPVVD